MTGCLTKHSPLFWLVALLASAMVSIGLQSLFAPADAAERFGVPVDTDTWTYLWAKGTRDIVTGLLGFGLLSLRVDRRVLAIFVGIVALIPLSDAIWVWRALGPAPVSVVIHTGMAVFAAVLAGLLWRRSPQDESAHASDVQQKVNWS